MKRLPGTFGLVLGEGQRVFAWLAHGRHVAQPAAGAGQDPGRQRERPADGRVGATARAEEVAAGLAKLVEAKRPTLVIWQTGTYDAMRSIDPDDFRGAVDEGVAALQNAGTDVILMNLQYSPRTETMISAPPYLDNMRVVAQQHDVPLFDRFAIMRHWNESGDFDLFSASHGVELAKRVHDCLGRALSKFVIDAAHLNPAQQN